MFVEKLGKTQEQDFKYKVFDKKRDQKVEKKSKRNRKIELEIVKYLTVKI